MSEPMPMPAWVQEECARLGLPNAIVVQRDLDERGRHCVGVVIETEDGRRRQLEPPVPQPPEPDRIHHRLQLVPEPPAPGFGGTWFRTSSVAHVAFGRFSSLCGVSMAGAKLVNASVQPSRRCRNCLAKATKLGLTETRFARLSGWHERLEDYLMAIGRRP